MRRTAILASRVLRTVGPLFLGAWLSACGGPDTVVNTPAPTPTPTPTPAPTPTPTPTPPPTGAVGLDSRPTNTTCLATAQPTFGVSVGVTRVFPNLTFTQPVVMLQAPGDNTTWYVVEQRGTIVSFPNVDSAMPASVTQFADLRDRVRDGGEAGLLGIAFDPAFAANGRVYLSYTGEPDPAVPTSVLQSRISRFTAAGGVLNAGSESVLLTIPQPFENHNGGHIAFGPDNLLYAGFGDGGSGGDPQNNAQNRSTLLGKLIRIDVSGAGAYAVPTDNPFAGAGSARCEAGTAAGGALCSEIYAYGLRNPWRWNFDRAASTPDIWLGDVGQGAWEEVDRIVPGGNYGWRVREGAHCYNAQTCATTNNGAPLIDPAGEYGRDLGSSITGGYVYRGTAIPSLVGRYVFGDFVSGRIFALLPDGSGALRVETILSTSLNISSFAQGSDGELYVLSYSSGSLHKLVPAAATQNPIRARLTETGCVDSANPTQPAAGLIPYEPVAPFWSDGAAKSRWMAVPDGQTITVGADGDWSFPNGTVLMKHFTLNGNLIETRLFMRHTDTGNWGGYTYRWNSTHTEATLVSGGLQETIGPQTWSYPSEAQCLQCHMAAAGRTLGLETRQLNSTSTYPATGRSGNQLATLQAIGMFAAPPAAQDPYPNPFDPAQPLAARARSYLHTNCAQCHRPNGGTPVTIDLQYSTPMSMTGTCNVAPVSGDLGVAGARKILPGDPGRSTLYLRMNRRGASQMPPIGSHAVDAQGVTLIHQWIAGMSGSCE